MAACPCAHPTLGSYDVSHVHAIFNNKGSNLLKTDKINLEYSDKVRPRPPPPKPAPAPPEDALPPPPPPSPPPCSTLPLPSHVLHACACVLSQNEYTHLYTMSFNPDGTYEILFDLESKAKGKIVEDWGFPKPMIDDASDSKPSDWVDDKEIDDPEAKKPDGYDDIPAQIPDPDATKPEDWDDEDDGEWEPPLIDNPEFKGEWIAPKVTNPEYKGEWSPKQIANKDYEEGVQLAAYDSAYIGFELWVVNNGTIFDNILVTDDLEYAKAQGEKLWRPTSKDEKEKKEAWDKENKPADEPVPDDDEGEGEGGEGEAEEEEKDEL
jgi:calreticulin